MSGEQSSLLSFPGPGARGSRLVALWVTEMESCQGYHDGAVKYGWLAASCLNNAAEQRMLVGVVPVPVVLVEPVPDRVSVVSRRASIDRGAAQDSAAVGAGPFLGVQWQHRQDVLGEGGEWQDKRRLVGGRSTVQMSRSGRPEKQMGHGRDARFRLRLRLGPTERTAGWTTLNRPGLGSLGGKDPLPGLRYQDGRAGRRGCTLLCPA